MPPKEDKNAENQGIEARLKALEEKEQALSAREAALDEKEAALSADRTALEEREEKFQKEMAGVQAKDPAPQEPPRPMVKYVCVKKCHYPVSHQRQATRKIYNPGDVYMAPEGVKVPESYFRPIKNKVDEAQANQMIEEENKKTLPGFIVDRALKQTGHLHVIE